MELPVRPLYNNRDKKQYYTVTQTVTSRTINNNVFITRVEKRKDILLVFDSNYRPKGKNTISTNVSIN